MVSGGDVVGGTHLYNKATGEVTGPYDSSSAEYNNLMNTGNYGAQWLIPFNADMYANVMQQACAEGAISAGWGVDYTSLGK